jgi:hypothetical protein
MQEFTKTIERVVKIRSSDRAISDAEFILSIGPSGIRIRRRCEPIETAMMLSWRSVISHALIHLGDVK